MTSLLATVLLGCAGDSRRPETARAAVVSSRYSHALHRMFYEAWAQPKITAAMPGRISVPVDVVIDRDGRVTGFDIVRPSRYPAIDRSIIAVRNRVRKVPPPPPLVLGDGLFRVRVFFDLDVKLR